MNEEIAWNETWDGIKYAQLRMRVDKSSRVFPKGLEFIITERVLTSWNVSWFREERIPNEIMYTRENGPTAIIRVLILSRYQNPQA